VATAPRRDPRSHRRADSRRHQLSEARRALGRRGAPVLRHAGQDGELSGGGQRRVLDGWARVDGRRALVSARRVGDARSTPTCPHSSVGAVPSKVALGPDAAAAGARQWLTVTAVVADAEFGNNATL